MFEWQGVRIRPVEQSDVRGDLGKLFWLRSDPRVRLQLGHVRMVSWKDQVKWFERMTNDPSSQYYVYYSDEIRFIGVVRTDEIDWVNRSMRVGGDIDPDLWDQGYGHRMFALLKKYCFDYLNMHRLWLLVLETNERAIAVYKQAGFVEEGRQREAIYRDGKYLDYVMMFILREDNDQNV